MTRTASGRALMAGVATAVVAGAAAAGMTASAAGAQDPGSPQEVALAFESQVDDVTTQQLQETALATLADPRGWTRSGFSFTADAASPYRVILAEPDAVDLLCAPIKTGGTLSCQNGNTVALNADRWRTGVEGWSGDIDTFHQYQVNHEVGHLIGQFHPANRCPNAGEPEAIMAPQAKGLEGCEPNVWPLDWEVVLAAARPVLLAPGPEVEPENRAVNPGGGTPGTLPPGGASTTASTTATTAAPDAAAPLTQVPPTTVDDDTTATLGNTPLSAPQGGAALSDPQLVSDSAAQRASGNSTVPLVALLVLISLAIVGLIVGVAVRWRRAAAQARLEADADADIGDGTAGDVLASGAASGSASGAAGVAAAGPAGPSAVPDGSDALHPLVGAPASVSAGGAWELRATGSARGRDRVAWFVPRRWGSEHSEALADALEELLGDAPSTQRVADAIAGVIRAHPELRPRESEGVGVVVLGDDDVVAAAFGAAEVVELRSGLAKPARRQGVARLRRQPGADLEVDVAPAGGSTQRGRILVSEPSS
ncbi:MAG: DUF3152 domain-containing protein [Microthrixaceae bacterium]